MTTSPTQIRITFNENVIPKFSGVELKDQTGKMIATGKAATDPTNKKQLVVPVQEQLPRATTRSNGTRCPTTPIA